MYDKDKIPKLPYGEGSIYIHNDQLLAYKKTITLKNGKQVRKVVFGKTPKICMDKMREAERELNAKNKETYKITLIDGINDWLANVHRYTVKQQTYERLLGTAKNQIESTAIGHARYQDVTSTDIQKVINDLNDQEYSFSVIKKTYDLLNAFYRYASAKDNIQNPMLLVVAPKSVHTKAEPKQVEWFEKDEITRFVNTSIAKYSNGRRRFKHGCALAANIYLGLRGGELLALQWKDVDFERCNVVISKTLVELANKEYDSSRPQEMKDLGIKKTIFVVQKNTKTYHDRAVQLNDMAKLLLLLHFDSTPYKREDDYVISTESGKTCTLKFLQETIKSMEKLANIDKPCNTHILRHTCASLYFKAGVPIEMICKFLGNSREVCEKTYVHFAQEQMKNAANQMLKVFQI